MALVFFAATIVFVALGIIATRKLHKARSRLHIYSLLSVGMMLAGALLWGGLLASPLTFIVSR